MNYNLTLKGHFQKLTLDGHAPTEKGHDAYQSIRIVKLNTAEIFPLL